MSRLIIASAQTSPKNEDIVGNLQDHFRLIKLAAENGVNLIVFPEMSITGYVRELAQKLSFGKSLDDYSLSMTGPGFTLQPRMHSGIFFIQRRLQSQFTPTLHNIHIITC